MNGSLIFISVTVDCGTIDAPMNGSLSSNQTVYPNSMHFACDPGFILSGSKLRICQANGTWDGMKTVCSGKINLCLMFNCAL